MKSKVENKKSLTRAAYLTPLCKPRKSSNRHMTEIPCLLLPSRQNKTKQKKRSIYPCRNSSTVTSFSSYHGPSFTFICEFQSPRQ